MRYSYSSASYSDSAMQTVPPFVALKALLLKLPNHPYFLPALALLTFVLFFILGRRTYESKFSSILNTINDAENEKKRLKLQKERLSDSQRFLNSKMLFLKLFSLALLGGLAAYCYLNKPDIIMIGSVGGLVVAMWVFVGLRFKYLKVMSTSTQDKLQRKSMSSQADTKELMGLLGPELCESLRGKFERELQMQWRNEQMKECDLPRCRTEKDIYRELYQLYKAIIGEMQQMAWCDVCSASLNIDANDLRLSEVEGRLKMYRQVGDKVNLEKRKQLTNRLLEEWQLLEGKLPAVCKRGCCIRFRRVLEDIKERHHSQLRSLKTRLSH